MPLARSRSTPNLFSFFARRDVRVRLGVHVGVHPQGHASGLFHVAFGLELPGETVDVLQFGFGLDVEHQDPGAQRLDEFGIAFAHAREDDLLHVRADLLYAGQFTAADDVEARAGVFENGEHAQAAVGFDRIADQVRDFRKGLVDLGVMVEQRLAGVDIRGRADFLGDLARGNVLGVKRSILVLKAVHGRRPRFAGGVKRAGSRLPARALNDA